MWFDTPQQNNYNYLPNVQTKFKAVWFSPDYFVGAFRVFCPFPKFSLRHKTVNSKVSPGNL